jgi:hypothetical protein
MRSEPYLPEAFQAIRDKDEKILWAGKPARLPFIISGLPFLFFGLCWGAFDYFGFIRHMGGKSGIPLGFAIQFFALHLIPFWASILNIVRLLLVVGNTYYAVTPKRLLMRTGFWGTDFMTVDYDQIANLEVSVNPIENVYGVGSIRFFPKMLVTGSRTTIMARFVGITNPYDVFKLIKQTSEAKPPAAA